jgi:DNA polymerase I
VARKKLFLIDSFGFIFRAYHARARSAAPPMRTSTGLSTEAVYIFNNMLRKLGKAYSPDYIAAVFESSAPTHRLAEFPEYKANRSEAPPDLAEQLPYVRRILGALRIPILEYPGFEADDVIGTIARRGEAAGLDVVVVSSDKDMLQLVTDRVTMLDPAKDDRVYDAEKVKEFLGVPPPQVADLFALKGDAIDNIPGAPGIGEKGAKDLIERFGSVEAAIERAAEVERKMYRESLQNNVDRIRLSKRLATIDTAVPIAFALENVVAREFDLDALKSVYKELEFYSLIRELGPSEDTRARDYQQLTTAAEVEAWLAAIPAGTPVALAISVPEEGELALGAFGLAWRPGEARTIGFSVLESLRGFLEDAARPKIVCDSKTARLAIERMGVEPRGFT